MYIYIHTYVPMISSFWWVIPRLLLKSAKSAPRLQGSDSLIELLGGFEGRDLCGLGSWKPNFRGNPLGDSHGEIGGKKAIRNINGAVLSEPFLIPFHPGS